MPTESDVNVPAGGVLSPSSLRPQHVSVPSVRSPQLVSDQTPLRLH
jgi:hypothetical protein